MNYRKLLFQKLIRNDFVMQMTLTLFSAIINTMYNSFQKIIAKIVTVFFKTLLLNLTHNYKTFLKDRPGWQAPHTVLEEC